MNILLILIYTVITDGYMQSITITKNFQTIPDCQIVAHELSMAIAEKGGNVTKAQCQELSK